MMEMTGHGGELALAALTRFGIEEMFTLSGGHIFPFYDASVIDDDSFRIVDVRHEQTATFFFNILKRLAHAHLGPNRNHIGKTHLVASRRTYAIRHCNVLYISSNFDHCGEQKDSE